jgi:hypothetical protein
MVKRMENADAFEERRKHVTTGLNCDALHAIFVGAASQHMKMKHMAINADFVSRHEFYVPGENSV